MKGTNRTNRTLTTCLYLLLVMLSNPAGAEEPINADMPFAERHVVLQISDANPESQEGTLSVAGNLMTHYGSPDLIDIQVVAFAQGVQLLRREHNPHAERIRALMDSNVRFFICQNTLDSIARRGGGQLEYLDGVVPVGAGVAHILEAVEAGYVLVRP